MTPREILSSVALAAAEVYLTALRASLRQGLDSPDPTVRGAVREMVLEEAARIRGESERLERALVGGA